MDKHKIILALTGVAVVLATLLGAWLLGPNSPVDFTEVYQEEEALTEAERLDPSLHSGAGEYRDPHMYRMRI